MIPKELGPWRIGKELGRGEFSSVCECTLKNGSQDQQVVWAMKLSPFAPPPLKTKEKKEQTCCRLLGWENQIYSLHLKNATCSFPRRPELASYGANEKGWRYLVIERFEGGTLKDRMSRNEIPQSTAFSAAIRILVALRHLHSRQFLFRDLKPENVMTFSHPEQDLEGRGVVLVDFGACTKYVDSKGDHFTDGGSPVGTPLFMSINVHSMGPPTRRDDLESLGYLLGWMLNKGQLPWSTCTSEAEILRAKQDSKLVQKMCANAPELGSYMEKVRELELEETPDYERLIKILEKAGGTSKGPIIFQSVVSSSSATTKRNGRNSRSPSSSSNATKKQVNSGKIVVELEDEEDVVDDLKKKNTSNSKRSGRSASQRKTHMTKSKKKTRNDDDDDEAYVKEDDEDEDDMEEILASKTKRAASHSSSNGRLMKKTTSRRRKKRNDDDDAPYVEEDEEDEEDEDEDEEEVMLKESKGRPAASMTATKRRRGKSNPKQKSSMDIVEEEDRVYSPKQHQRTSLISRASEKAKTQMDQTTTTKSNKRTRRSLSSDGSDEATTTSRRRQSSSSSTTHGRRGSKSGTNKADEEGEGTTSRIQPMRTAKEMIVKAGVFLSAAAILYSGSYVQNSVN